MTAALSDAMLAQAAERFGTPCFIYAADAIEERIARLHEVFRSRFTLSFAVKSNPNPAMLAWLNGRIGHLDISSIGEMRLALGAGWDASRISFTGPAKRVEELREAMAAGLGLLVVESVREARAADAIARSMGRKQPVLVRIAPDSLPRGFGDHMAGRPSPFGIDQEDADSALAEIRALPALSVVGLHIYSGTQCLKAEAVVENYRAFLTIFRRLCANHDLMPEKLVFGSGLGIPYHDGDAPLDLPAVADAIGPELDRLVMDPRFRQSGLMLELGRYLVAEAGYFLTRIVSTKESRGTRIAICDGGMNNHLPASGHFGMVVRRNYRMHKLGGQGPREKIDIVGPLCTSIDRLASAVELPHVEEGDVIAVHQSGAYGLTASPFHFISHAPPAELMVVDGQIRDITRFFAEGARESGMMRHLA
ncbi:type III PLP-dependent enzyme [Sphingobium sp. PNB]|uniref:type III PLP-dependent enzyme n=1 Tax=Sphingobium sp. PNB TaxID=863934 RepID=UPI001CA46DD1|nr:type III PLP-dependent enzyme [Sphingobium sp. PNB]MCB4858143.1 type III PLP-dependent enzyme [Sphingobium sp. PNB]